MTTVRLTYGELAKKRGITLAAARRLATRHKWPKQVGNDGLSHVLVPASVLVRWERAGKVDTPDDSRVDPTEAIRLLGDAITSLREQLTREQERADRAEARLQELTVRRRWWRRWR